MSPRSTLDALTRARKLIAQLRELMDEPKSAADQQWIITSLQELASGTTVTMASSPGEVIRQ